MKFETIKEIDAAILEVRRLLAASLDIQRREPTKTGEGMIGSYKKELIQLNSERNKMLYKSSKKGIV